MDYYHALTIIDHIQTSPIYTLYETDQEVLHDWYQNLGEIVEQWTPLPEQTYYGEIPLRNTAIQLRKLLSGVLEEIKES